MEDIKTYSCGAGDGMYEDDDNGHYILKSDYEQLNNVLKIDKASLKFMTNEVKVLESMLNDYDKEVRSVWNKKYGGGL